MRGRAKASQISDKILSLHQRARCGPFPGGRHPRARANMPLVTSQQLGSRSSRVCFGIRIMDLDGCPADERRCIPVPRDRERGKGFWSSVLIQLRKPCHRHTCLCVVASEATLSTSGRLPDGQTCIIEYLHAWDRVRRLSSRVDQAHAWPGASHASVRDEPLDRLATGECVSGHSEDPAT